MNILVSVSNKSGLIEFLKPLADKGARILSTGGTSQFLKANGINVVDISEQTHFPEVLGGRVKTLHPMVHMALLARMDREDDKKILQEYKIDLFDMVVVNLYPFEEALKSGTQYPELVEKIDVGGPSMLRAAAKNHFSIASVCDPQDYGWIKEKNYNLDLEDRQKLALKVFSHTGHYDLLIAQNLMAHSKQNKSSDEILTMPETKLVQTLRYGENPHQKAEWYGSVLDKHGLHHARILQGKELSFNNILDIDAAVNLLQHLDSAACVAVKHNNPCGVAIDSEILAAVENCLRADPVSVFGGIVAINKPVDGPVAKILSECFLECIVATHFEPQALEILARKKNLRLLEWASMSTCPKTFELKSIFGGFVRQDMDKFEPSKAWNNLRDTPSPSVLNDCIFGEKVCASLKSNSIAIVKNGITLGLGMGQVNRVDSVELAIKRFQKFHSIVQDPIMVSDAFFPFPDSIELAAKAGIKWILQPGGSVRDEEVFAVAEKLGVNMIITGNRHFRH